MRRFLLRCYALFRLRPRPTVGQEMAAGFNELADQLESGRPPPGLFRWKCRRCGRPLNPAADLPDGVPMRLGACPGCAAVGSSGEGDGP